ncbi:MFS transporter [Microbacterium sp. W1N]|uniref:MFS transporter n=1 Tax=Microbacterium festucae TaxID=2977531 RepID=UPI0021C10E69|nr:MFS transporter [Microbacterium festucae]MCT9819237.1 MFS transporter [Microbacterium festucae]
MATDAAATAPPALRRSTIARYAAGSIGTGGFATLPGLVLTYYLTDNLGVTALMAGAIVTVAKVWDVVVDPVIGALTDADRARHGSRRRLMLIGALALPVLFAATFAVPPALSPVFSAIWVMVAFLLTATAFSLFQVPYIALPAELSDRYDERTRLLTWRVVVLTFAILLFGAGGPLLRRIGDPTTGYLIMGIVSGVVIGLGMLIATGVAGRAHRRLSGMSAAATAAAEQAELVAGQVVGDPARGVGRDASTPGGGIRDNFRAALETLRRSQPFRALLATFFLQALATGLMLAGAQYLATWVMRSEDAVTLLFVALIAPALVAAPAWGDIARRIGKETAFGLASALFAVAALSTFAAAWLPGLWIYASVAVAGVAYAGMQSLPMAMLPDVIGHDARRHGPGRAGAFGGVWTAGETTGFALGATMLTITLAATGYIESTAGVAVTQPDAAVNGIVVAFSIVPAALVLLSLIPLSRYRLRRADVEADALG